MRVLPHQQVFRFLKEVAYPANYDLNLGNGLLHGPVFRDDAFLVLDFDSESFQILELSILVLADGLDGRRHEFWIQIVEANDMFVKEVVLPEGKVRTVEYDEKNDGEEEVAEGIADIRSQDHKN